MIESKLKANNYNRGQLFRPCWVSSARCQGRNEVYGIRDQRPEKGWDPGSQPRDRDERCFSLDQGSGVLDNKRNSQRPP